jgi:hypothetical protein
MMLHGVGKLMADPHGVHWEAIEHSNVHGSAQACCQGE